MQPNLLVHNQPFFDLAIPFSIFFWARGGGGGYSSTLCFTFSLPNYCAHLRLRCSNSSVSELLISTCTVCAPASSPLKLKLSHYRPRGFQEVETIRT